MLDHFFTQVGAAAFIPKYVAKAGTVFNDLLSIVVTGIGARSKDAGDTFLMSAYSPCCRKQVNFCFYFCRREYVANGLFYKLRIVAVGEAGTMRLFPGQVRMADIAFTSWDRLPGRTIPTQPMSVASLIALSSGEITTI